jgi:hypothetical protein
MNGLDSLVPGPLKSVFEERILAAAFVGSGPRESFSVLWKQAVATLRRHFCDDGLQPQCGLESSRLRQLFVLVARVRAVAECHSEYLVMERRNLAHDAKAPIPTGAARALLSCSICDGVHGYLDALSSPFLWSRVSEGG